MQLTWHAATVDDDALAAGLQALRRDLEVPGIEEPDAAVEAEAVAAAGPLHDASRRVVDLRFVALDPAGSRDLDQVFHIEARGGGRGWRVHYAIADVAAWVRPGGAVDRQAFDRGTTLYLPDARVPLHPPVLSESAASLLMGPARPAILWELEVGAEGELTAWDVYRAEVRTAVQADYARVQHDLDAGTAAEPFHRLRDVGRALRAAEAARGGVSLELPEQVVRRVDGGHALAYESPLEVESWNAQLSLAAGRAAAQLMARTGVGLLRTLPEPDPEVLAGLRRTSLALGVPWSDGTDYPGWVRSLRPGDPTHAALLTGAARALRGSGYTVLDRDAIAAPYAHVTAPLRRLADRHAAECALAAATGSTVPDWAADALEALPKVMAEASRRQGAIDRAVVDLIEALVLQGGEGTRFDAVVTAVHDRGTQVQLLSPAIVAPCEADGVSIGDPVTVELVEADPVARSVRFRLCQHRGP